MSVEPSRRDVIAAVGAAAVSAILPAIAREELSYRSAGELVAALVRLAEAPEMRAELAARGRARGAWLAGGDVGGELLEVYEAALAERGLR